MHEIEGFVDIGEGHFMRDEVIDIDFTLHVPVDNFRDIGASSGTPKSGPSPGAPGDQLERSGRYFLTGAGNANNAALAPAFMAAL